MERPALDLDAFLADRRRAIERFAEFWREGVAKEPAHYPNEMPLGEWDEQFRCFEGG